MKILHFSDTHLGATRYSIRQSYFDFINAFKEVVNLIFEIEPDIVIHSGDLFDSKRPDSLIMRIAFSEILKISKRFPFLIIPGNHEISVNTGLSPISILSNISDHVKVVEQRDIIESKENNENFIQKLKFHFNGINFYLLPYLGNKKLLREIVDEILNDLNTSYINFLVLHQIVDEETSRSKGRMDIDIPIENLLAFDFIFLGHFHIPKIRRNFAYAGSTEALRYDEYEYDEKGFIKENSKKQIVVYNVLNKQDIKKEKFILKSPREFLKLEFNEPQITEIENVLRNYENPNKILILKLNNIEPSISIELKRLLSNFNFYYIHSDINFKTFEYGKFEFNESKDYRKEILGEYYEDILKIMNEFDDDENDKVQMEEIIRSLRKLREFRDDNKLNKA